jgi:1-acyl-sn-glycerol-3-phosphate acyltransferase
MILKMKKFFYNFIYPLYLPFWVIFLIANTTVLGVIVITMSFIPGLDPNNFAGYKIGKFWAWLNLGLAGTRVKVIGEEKIDRDRSYVIMSNHQSHFDVWALIKCLPLSLRWVMKIELRRIPVFGIGCEKLGQIYVDRSNTEKARESLEAARVKIDAGASVMFFPEGTRSADGGIQEFKKGGFVMALETETPILPITVNGGRFALPKGRPLAMKPGRIQIIIHNPVEVKGLKYDDREKLLNKVRGIIEGGLDLEYGRPY